MALNTLTDDSVQMLVRELYQLKRLVRNTYQVARRPRRFGSGGGGSTTPIYLAQAPNGIPGRSGATAGKAVDVEVYEIDDDDEILKVDPVEVVTAYNTAQEAVGANVYIHLKEEAKTNRLLVDWEECVPAIGYGSMNLGTPGASFPNLGAAYQDITVFDTVGDGPVGATVNTTTGQFSFLEQGIWQLSISVSFEHNSTNNGRTTNVRLWNVTKGAASNSFIIGTGRNAEASNASISLSVVVQNPSTRETGDLFVWQIGGGDTYSSVSFQSASHSMTLVQSL